jgi:hypothetical protein
MITDYSEDKTSTWISENLPLPEHGVYCDVGCAHPFQYSQTAFLRERGWKGIVIDANSDYGREWKDVDAIFLAAVISSNAEEKFLIEPTNSLVSRRHETGRSVLCSTLEWALHNVPKIDFLSLDVEGMEMEALLSLSESKWPPIIVAEYNSMHAGQDFRVLHRLVERGYEVKHVTGSNIVYFRP